MRSICFNCFLSPSLNFQLFFVYLVFTHKEVNCAHPNWTCNRRRPELFADKERLTTDMALIRVGDWKPCNEGKSGDRACDVDSCRRFPGEIAQSRPFSLLSLRIRSISPGTRAGPILTYSFTFTLVFTPFTYIKGFKLEPKHIKIPFLIPKKTILSLAYCMFSEGTEEANKKADMSTNESVVTLSSGLYNNKDQLKMEFSNLENMLLQE